MAFLKTEAIVIKTTDLQEADRIVTFFSNDHGKIQGIAKSVRKIKARYGGKLELFNKVNVIFFQKIESMQGSRLPERHPLLRITQVDVVESFSQLKLDFNKIIGASYVAEFLNRVFEEYDDTHKEVYPLVCETFQALSATERIRNILPAFEIKLLAHLGYAPILKYCSNCKIQTEFLLSGSNISYLGFSSSSGGMLCPKCTPLKKDSLRISVQTLKILRQFLTSPMSRTPDIPLAQKNYQEIKVLLTNHFQYHVGVALKTDLFVQKLRAANVKNTPPKA